MLALANCQLISGNNIGVCLTRKVSSPGMKAENLKARIFIFETLLKNYSNNNLTVEEAGSISISL